MEPSTIKLCSDFLDWSPYISLKITCRWENYFIKRSKHFPFGDHFMTSHNLFSCLSIDIIKRELMLVSIGAYRINYWKKQKYLQGYQTNHQMHNSVYHDWQYQPSGESCQLEEMSGLTVCQLFLLQRALTSDCSHELTASILHSTCNKVWK